MQGKKSPGLTKKFFRFEKTQLKPYPRIRSLVLNIIAK